jgi:hypothetical protein
VTVFAVLGRPLLAIAVVAITAAASLAARLLIVLGMLRAWTASS